MPTYKKLASVPIPPFYLVSHQLIYLVLFRIIWSSLPFFVWYICVTLRLHWIMSYSTVHHMSLLYVTPHVLGTPGVPHNRRVMYVYSTSTKSTVLLCHHPSSRDGPGRRYH